GCPAEREDAVAGVAIAVPRIEASGNLVLERDREPDLLLAGPARGLLGGVQQRGADAARPEVAPDEQVLDLDAPLDPRLPRAQLARPLHERVADRQAVAPGDQVDAAAGPLARRALHVPRGLAPRHVARGDLRVFDRDRRDDDVFWRRS